MEVKTSGEKRKFDTGAHRDLAEGKGRCDLLPLEEVARVMGKFVDLEIPSDCEPVVMCIQKFRETKNLNYIVKALQESIHTLDAFDSFADMMLEVSCLYESGSKVYGEDNWRKGMPLKVYVDSGLRHYFKTLRGDSDEAHYRGFVWNMLCLMWTARVVDGEYDYRDEDIDNNDEDYFIE